MSDRVRLARAFDVPLLSLDGRLALSLILFALGPATGFLATGILASLVGAAVATEQHAIAKGLREVIGWGFPVEGYRAWLLAAQPSFDVELQGEVSLDMLQSSAAAVDKSILVMRRGPRVVRFVTQQLELPGNQNQDLVRVADRRLLRELRDRILTPLHEAAGIVALRMGDYTTLAALVARPRVDAGGTFREQAMTAPAALQSLVHAGSAQRRPASEARALRLRDDRVILANGERPPSSGAVGWAMATAAMAGGFVLGGAGVLVGAFLGGGAMFGLSHASARKRVRAIVADVNSHGYPVEGYEEWLLSGRPIFDVELAEPCDRAYVEVLLGVHEYTVTWLADTLVRIESKPWLVETAGTAIPLFWGGNRVMFAALQHKLIGPLHQRYGVVAVRMGGYVDRRA